MILAIQKSEQINMSDATLEKRFVGGFRHSSI